MTPPVSRETGTDDVSRETSSAPLEAGKRPAAEAAFGDRLALAEQYADSLATTGIEWGLIGPREVPRIWDRHLINCAAVAELIPAGASVADVGAGAGLPGVVIAIARPDVSVTLIEPKQRRCLYLEQIVAELGLTNAAVQRARAQEAVGSWDVVTARAVARLDVLVDWCLPLLSDDGDLLALKGESVTAEIDELNDRKVTVDAVEVVGDTRVVRIKRVKG